jgi:thiamine pyrophosphokinase
MIINIVAGGPPNLIPEFTNNDEDIFWVGVDRGTLFLLKHNIKPIIAFGDFDSITDTEFNEIKQGEINIKTFQAEKDFTDLELAINWAIQEQPTLIRLYGVTGGRLDHELINIQMLIKGLGTGIPIVIIDKQNEIQLMSPGEYKIQKDHLYPYISFLAVLETVECLSLEGFKYGLDNSTLKYGSSLCISNELNKSFGTYLFTKGILMMIRSRDRFRD